MEHSRFDDDIRKKLEGRQEAYESASWEQMSSLLDQTDLSVPEDLDPLLKEKLAGHHETFKPEHWQILEEELDYIDARRRRLYVFKLAEAAILLLLVFTYWNYQRFNGGYEVQVDHDYLTVIAEEPASAVPEGPVITLAEPNPQPPATIEEMIPRLNNPISTLLSEEKRPAIKAIKKAAPGMSRPINPSPEALSVGSIEELPVSWSLPGPVLLEDQSLETVVLTNPRSRKGWWVSLPVSYDFNVINTAFKFDYLTSHANQGLVGQSVGVGISYLFKNIEIESGIRYSDKTYSPGLLSNYTKSSKNSFLESQLNAAHIRQVQIPLMVKLHAFNPSRSNLYALAGIGFNAVLDLDYTIRKTIQPSARVLTQDASQTILDLRKLPEGFAEGGHFKDNMYMTAILGIGFQTRLRDDIGFYFQPQYQYHLTSDLNVLIKKVHTLNIEAGIRFKF